jgi:WD40 repeat protein
MKIRNLSSESRGSLKPFRALFAFVTGICFLLPSFKDVHAQGGYHEILLFGPDAKGGLFFSLAYSPDSKLMAIGTYTPHAIEIRDAHTGRILKTLMDQSEQRSAPISIPTWNPSGEFIAEVSIEYGPTPNTNHGIIYIWNVNTGSRITIPNRNDPTSKYADAAGNIGTRYVAWHPNGKEVLIMDNERKLRFLDFPSGKTRWIIAPYINQPAEFQNAESENPCRPQWSSDGSRFVCIGDGIQAIFDGATGNHLFDLKDEVGLDAHPQWTNDGKYIANVDTGEGGNSYAIKIWNANNGEVSNLPTKSGFPYSISPDSTRVAYVENISNQVVVAAFKIDKLLARLDIDYNPNDPVPSWSSDGKYLAVIDRNSTIHIFSAELAPF